MCSVCAPVLPSRQWRSCQPRLPGAAQAATACLALSARRFPQAATPLPPQVLFEQFSYFFNLYFLLVAASQFFPPLVLGLRFSYVAPLAFVLVVTMSKAALTLTLALALLYDARCATRATTTFSIGCARAG